MLTNFMKDSVALGAVAVVFALGFLGIGAALISFRWLQRQVEALEAVLPELLNGGKPALTRAVETLWEEFQKRFVGPITMSASSPPQRILLREPVEPALEACGRSLLRSGWRGMLAYGIGENLTGVALIITFGLLGYVLIGPVYEALRGATEAAQSAKLSDAIQQMGAKFFVSATGVLLAILFQALSRELEERVSELTRRLWYRHTERFEMLEALQVRTANERLDELRRVRDELRETRESWSQQFQRLESIEVSIQGIGNEVSTHFGNLMKQQVADIICDKMAALEESARAMAEQMSNAFGAFVAKEMASVRSALDELQRTVAGQSQSDLERILIQLRDVVSGGFHSQSQDMARQMGQLVSLLPRLEEQFSTMSSSLSQNARSWNERNQRAVQELGERVTVLVTQFELVRGGLQESVERLLQSTAQSSARLQSDAQSQMNATAQQMAELRRATAQDVASFEERTRGFTSAMSKSQEELTSLLSVLRNATGEFATLLKNTATAQDKSNATVSRFDETARQLTQGAQSLVDVLQKRSIVLEREEKLLAAQRSAVDALEGSMRQVFISYESSVRTQSAMLAEQWKKLAGDVRSIVERSSQELTENVEDLTTTVNDLKKSLQGVTRGRS